MPYANKEQRLNYRRGYQVLCFNCDRGKGTKDNCPHKQNNVPTDPN